MVHDPWWWEVYTIIKIQLPSIDTASLDYPKRRTACITDGNPQIERDIKAVKMSLLPWLGCFQIVDGLPMRGSASTVSTNLTLHALTGRCLQCRCWSHHQQGSNAQVSLRDSGHLFERFGAPVRGCNADKGFLERARHWAYRPPVRFTACSQIQSYSKDHHFIYIYIPV